MIRLTETNGKQIWINPEHIVDITGRTDGEYEKTFVSTVIDVNDAYPRTVTESPEEVAQKVLEWKLAIERYRLGYAEALNHQGDPQWIFENAELKLSSLAGLEEQKDEI